MGTPSFNFSLNPVSRAATRGMIKRIKENSELWLVTQGDKATEETFHSMV
jgi:hypothetical protein